jgi:hypothetical protein
MISIIKKGPSEKITKVEVTASQEFKFRSRAPFSLDGTIQHLTSLVQSLVTELKAKETRLPTSGTQMPSDSEIYDAALRKVHESDMPLSSVLAQQHHREKECDDTNKAPSEDESTRSICNDDAYRDFNEDVYQPAPIIIIRPKA